MKRLEVRQKHSAARRIFNSLPSVSSGDEALRLVLNILRHINILIQNTIQVLSCIFISIYFLYDWIVIIGYSKHELSTVNMLYSLKKLSCYTPSSP